MYLYLWVRVPEDNQTCAGFLYASEELRKHQLSSCGPGNNIYSPKSKQNHTTHAHANISLHVNKRLSWSPRLKWLPRASAQSALTLSLYSMIYPPRNAMKLSLWTPRSDSISLRLPICKCQLISQARPPSWTPNTANCSFLCILLAKQHINWDEGKAWSFHTLYILVLRDIRGR